MIIYDPLEWPSPVCNSIQFDWSPTILGLSAVSLISRVSGAKWSEWEGFSCTRFSLEAGPASKSFLSKSEHHISLSLVSFGGMQGSGYNRVRDNWDKLMSRKVFQIWSSGLWTFNWWIPDFWKFIYIKVFQVMVVRHVHGGTNVRNWKINSQTYKKQPLPIYQHIQPIQPSICIWILSQVHHGYSMLWLTCFTFFN